MSEAKDYDTEPVTGGKVIRPDFGGLLNHMRAAVPVEDGTTTATGDGDVAAEAGDPIVEGLPEGTHRRVLSSQRIVRARAGEVMIIDRTREYHTYIIVGPDDPRVRDLDGEPADAADEPAERHEEAPEEPARVERPRRVRKPEDDRPLELGKTFRLLGGRALTAVKNGVAGTRQELIDGAERRYQERQQAEADHGTYRRETHKVRVLRQQLDEYFELIAKGGLNTGGRLPVNVVGRLRQMDRLDCPYFGEYFEQPDNEA